MRRARNLLWPCRLTGRHTSQRRGTSVETRSIWETRLLGGGGGGRRTAPPAARTTVLVLTSLWHSGMAAHRPDSRARNAFVVVWKPSSHASGPRLRGLSGQSWICARQRRTAESYEHENYLCEGVRACEFSLEAALHPIVSSLMRAPEEKRRVYFLVYRCHRPIRRL